MGGGGRCLDVKYAGECTRDKAAEMTSLQSRASRTAQVRDWGPQSREPPKAVALPSVHSEAELLIHISARPPGALCFDRLLGVRAEGTGCTKSSSRLDVVAANRGREQGRAVQLEHSSMGGVAR